MSVSRIDILEEMESKMRMPRKLRVQYAGAIYHVMNRGDRRENIFEDEQDHVRFMETLGEDCQKTGWQVHAWCLMGNHFHWVVKTPKGDKRKVMLAAEFCANTTMTKEWIASASALDGI